MDRFKNLGGIFHALIIAIFLLSLNACGYKAPPYYIEDTPVADENVEFILQDNSEQNKLQNDHNTSSTD
ncbi:MAG: hypothetical protein JXQ67_08360 [Campylobacterales bacterium]|nr:hypothetical protein [Campylobacterales bacterium]